VRSHAGEPDSRTQELVALVEHVLFDDLVCLQKERLRRTFYRTTARPIREQGCLPHMMRGSSVQVEKHLLWVSGLYRDRQPARIMSTTVISGMNAMLIRQLIQLRLGDGRLPQDRSLEVWSGSGAGTCDACGVAIEAF